MPTSGISVIICCTLPSAPFVSSLKHDGRLVLLHLSSVFAPPFQLLTIHSVSFLCGVAAVLYPEEYFHLLGHCSFHCAVYCESLSCLCGPACCRQVLTLREWLLRRILLMISYFHLLFG